MNLPRPLLRRIPRDQLPPAMQAAWDQAMANSGDATFIEVLGNNPAMFDWYVNGFYGQVFHAGRLDRRVLELLRLRLANLHGCAFCNKGDRVQALAAGLSESELDALPDYENGPFSDAEKAALALADEMALTNMQGRLTPALHARLRAHFSDGDIVELGMLMAVLCGMAKFLFAFDLVEREPACPFPAGA